MNAESKQSMSSGPITVVVMEGMVSVAKREYPDTWSARRAEHRWPDWTLRAFRKIEREAEEGRVGAYQDNQIGPASGDPDSVELRSSTSGANISNQDSESA